jgi:hypothetical protein
MKEDDGEKLIFTDSVDELPNTDRPSLFNQMKERFSNFFSLGVESGY